MINDPNDLFIKYLIKTQITMKIKNTICAIFVLTSLLLNGCENEDKQEVIISPISLEVEVLYQDTILKKEKPDQKAKIYFYDGVYPYNYTHISDGKLEKDGYILLPDTIVTVNEFGKAIIYPKDKNKEISFLIESGYFKDRFSLSNVSEIRKAAKATVLFKK